MAVCLSKLILPELSFCFNIKLLVSPVPINLKVAPALSVTMVI